MDVSFTAHRLAPREIAVEIYQKWAFELIPDDPKVQQSRIPEIWTAEAIYMYFTFTLRVCKLGQIARPRARSPDLPPESSTFPSFRSGPVRVRVRVRGTIRPRRPLSRSFCSLIRSVVLPLLFAFSIDASRLGTLYSNAVEGLDKIRLHVDRFDHLGSSAF